MPHVSKHKLDEETFDKIFRRFILILEQAHGKRKFLSVIEELLTETEKVMLAKRISIILMLISEMPQHRISDLLLVSPSTVAKLALRVEIGDFNSIKSISKRERLNLEKIMWALLTAGGFLPPISGRKYWRKKGYKTILD